MPEENRENDLNELRKTNQHENDSTEQATITHDKVLERRVVRKCDFYMLRNATIAGFDYKYLNSTPSEYNLAIAIYFASYMAFEIPSNFVTKVLGFQVWMPIIMLCWAAASMSQAACKSALQLGITRFFLGMAEAGFPPSVIEYVGFFYARKELTLRYSIFMALITISGALGGIAVNEASLKGFQWLFIIESIPTIIMAIVVALYMTSGPGDARFLTPEERKFALDRLRPEGGPAPIDRKTTKAQIKLAFKDITIYVYLILLFLGSIPFNALNFFLPTLVKQLGFSNVTAQLMVVPPLLVSTVWMTFNSWASDRYQTRTWNLVASYSLSIIGLVGIMATNSQLYTLKYFFLVLLSCGAYSVLPIVFSWFTCNIGFVGILIYPADEAPLFIKGNLICLASVILQTILTFGLKFYLENLNKKRDLAILTAKDYKIDNDLKKNTKKLREIAMKLVENEPRFDEILCDSHPNWRYIT
ncbi:16552_t:CDS:2 [Cetraspora pellucida]|uniref:16552_t:CDS:1 n=1 Tax=Cetraspora pellucida TaxID=1433469 RepID=A0A9N9B249_9GLOM|nr:16552_t:CDS:2 [Cetraspora pellucida]